MLMLKERKKLKRKLSTVEETNSDKEKNKIRKSELDLLDGTIVSRRHGRTCTKDQEEGTINKPEKKFKKPVIKGVKEKKPNVLSKEALSQLPGTTKERRSSTSSTISNSSELSITSALNKLESLKTGGKLSSSSKMSEPESLKSKASTSSKTSTSSKSSTKTKKNVKELNKNEEKVDNSTAQKKTEPDKAKKKLKKPLLKARTRLTPSTRSINSSGISASVTKKIKKKKPTNEEIKGSVNEPSPKLPKLEEKPVEKDGSSKLVEKGEIKEPPLVKTKNVKKDQSKGENKKMLSKTKVTGEIKKKKIIRKDKAGRRTRMSGSNTRSTNIQL